jgi:molecular chaperone GrpE
MKTKVDQLKEMMKAKKDPPKDTAAEKPKSEENFDTKLKTAEDAVKENYDKLLRVMAEFENYKKRSERERIEQSKYCNQSLLHDLLPVFDDFDRVLNHIPEKPAPEIISIVDGVKLTQNHFIGALAKHGFVLLENSVGKPFNPNEHEAVSYIESADFPEGIVAVEHRRGWKLHDRVIRAATVSVSKGKK